MIRFLVFLGCVFFLLRFSSVQELDFYRTAGPVEWTLGGEMGDTWKWRQPPNTFWDERQELAVRVRSPGLFGLLGVHNFCDWLFGCARAQQGGVCVCVCGGDSPGPATETRYVRQGWL